MKFLIDQNRSPRLAGLLVIAGTTQAHTVELGLEREEDDALLMLAAKEGRVIVSGDTDFGALLALLRRRSPSVILSGRDMRLPPRIRRGSSSTILRISNPISSRERLSSSVTTALLHGL